MGSYHRVEVVFFDQIFFRNPNEGTIMSRAKLLSNPIHVALDQGQCEFLDKAVEHVKRKNRTPELVKALGLEEKLTWAFPSKKMADGLIEAYVVSGVRCLPDLEPVGV